MPTHLVKLDDNHSADNQSNAFAQNASLQRAKRFADLDGPRLDLRTTEWMRGFAVN